MYITDLFSGRYEWPPSGYKHVYFNVTLATLKIWLLLVLAIIALYESIRYVAPLIWRGKSRTPMVALFVTSLLPHYQGWWELFGFINEDFYDTWKQQAFFSITEVFSTGKFPSLTNVIGLYIRPTTAEAHTQPNSLLIYITRTQIFQVK